MKNVLGVLCAFGIVLGISNRAFGWTDMAYRGEMNSWGNTAFTLENGIWRGSVSAPGTDASSEFQLYASDSGGTWWGAGFWFSPQTFYDVGQGGNAIITPGGVTAGNYYTFTVDNASDLHVFMQETVAAPVSIVGFSSEVSNGGSFDPVDNYASSSVANNVNTVAITLNTAPSAGENVYIAYSTDNFATAPEIVQASGSGTSWSANIGAQGENTTVSYYVLTSTFSEGTLDGVGSNFDVLFRALDENSSSAQNYTIYDLGDSFHIPTQTAGTAGESMLAGSNGTLSNWLGDETEARVYSGNVFQNVGEAADQSSYTLHYKIGAGGWQTAVGSFDNENGNDKYWLATIDLTGAAQGSLVQYYLEYNYTTGEDTTFVYADGGGGSRVTGNETTAQNGAFNFTFGENNDPPGAVPEPNTLSMAMVAGLIAVSLRYRFKRQRKAAMEATA